MPSPVLYFLNILFDALRTETRQANLNKLRTIETAVFNASFECLQHSKNRKSVPLQAWSGPECSRKLRFPDFMTTAQDGGKVVGLTHRPPLPPGNTPGT